MEPSWLLLLASVLFLFFTIALISRHSARLKAVELATTEVRFHLGHLGQRLSSVEWMAASSPPTWAPSVPRTGEGTTSAFRTTAAVEAPPPWEPARRRNVLPSEPSEPAFEAVSREALPPSAPPTSARLPSDDSPPPTHALAGGELEPEASAETKDDAAIAWDWERWLGVRGAAALGAGILVIALLFFLRYSIDQGWLTPAMRVGLGVLVSGGLIAGAELRLRHVHPVMAAWLSGAGLAGLFAATWAAQAVVGLFGAGTAFVIFIGLTAATIGLAVHRASLPVALLGLSGGFAAPLALLGFEMTASALSGRAPMVLSYVLLLDVAMIVLSARRRWWVLAVLSLLVSSAYLGVWLQASAGHGELAVQVALLTVFAAVFGALPAFVSDLASDHPLARLVRGGAVVVPIAFSLFLLTQPAVLERPLPIGVLLVLVTSMALALSARHRDNVGPLIASSGSLVVLGAWLSSADVAAHLPELAALLATLAALFVLAPRVLWRRLSGVGSEPAAEQDAVAFTWGATSLFLGVSALFAIAASIAAPSGWPIGVSMLVGLGALALYFARQSGVRSLASSTLFVTSAGMLAIVAAGIPAWTGGGRGLEASVALGLAAALLGGILLWGQRTAQPLADELTRGVRTSSSLMLLGASLFSGQLSLPGHWAALVAFSCIGLASLRGSATHFLLQGLLAVTAAVAYHFAHGETGHAEIAAVAIAAGFGCAALSPRVALAREGAVHAQTGLLVGAAIVPLLTGHGVWIDATPSWFLLAVLALGLLVADARRHGHSPSDDTERDLSAWLGTFAAGALTAIAIVCWTGPVRLFAMSLIGLALLTGYRVLGTKTYLWLGFLELGYMVVRVLGPRTLLPRSDSLVASLIELLIPTASCFAAWALLRGDDASPRSDRAPLRALLGSAGLVLGFFAVNALFARIPGALGFELEQARDLSMSLAWATYGLTLLLVGVRLESSAHRWVSLVLVLATAAKVFLFDLARLGDLYRVGSLVGLAFSLLGISLLYQRLVFRAGGAAAGKP